MDSLPPDPARPAPEPGAAERTSTVVIGSGLSGLAVASELSRRGIDAIVVESVECSDSGALRTVMTDSASLSERTELMRLLRGYATAHSIDVRQTTVAEQLCIIGHPRILPTPVERKKWAVQTAGGVLLADHVVLTKFPQNELRRLLRSMDIAIGRDVREALRAIGLYLVGVGELLAPSTREIVRQAKLVSDAIVEQGPSALDRVGPRPAISPR
ncbi:FAD-dependent monooxygenase [Arthrobacter sp. Ld5]|uniref:FAD-dependent monooxygenase n=1 Tax=Arthrobacter sp. Ld5 TaxID=649152 RepID=UPI003EB6E08F